ncbi:HD family hydrolase [Patescibacteria group bacterium]
MNTSKIVNFFFEISSLRRLTRSHRQVIDQVNDNISDHSFRTAIIGMIIAEMEKGDKNKVLKMCLFHDIAEARTGDANTINKLYVKQNEKGAIKDQMKDLPISKDIVALLEEFCQKKTKEAKIAKDADILDQMVLQQEYFNKDLKNRKIWQDSSEKDIKTKSAKKLAKMIRKTDSIEWAYSLIKEKRL